MSDEHIHATGIDMIIINLYYLLHQYDVSYYASKDWRWVFASHEYIHTLEIYIKNEFYHSVFNKNFFLPGGTGCSISFKIKIRHFRYECLAHDSARVRI